MYSLFGSRKQSSVNDAENFNEHMSKPTGLKLGVIIDVFTSDNPKNVPGISSGAQGYVTYNIELTPDGVIVENVPAMMTGGKVVSGIAIDPNYPPNVPNTDIQNTEETPFIIGQPVIVGFLNNSHLNPFILGPISFQLNNGTQSFSEYPQKTASWQGTNWKIDKNGFPTVNLVASGILRVQLNGLDLVTVNGATNTVDIGNGGEPGVLGNTLVAYLNSHTHAPGTFSNGGGPVVGFSGPPVQDSSGVKTTILKVQ